MGQKAKYSPRADVFRFTPNNGRAVTAPPRPFRAKFENGRGHSITSSAIIRIDRGRARPTPFAVFDCQPEFSRLLVQEAVLWAIDSIRTRGVRPAIVSAELS
jgi:hypothetical protein